MSAMVERSIIFLKMLPDRGTLLHVILLKTRIMDEKTAEIRKEYTQKALMESGVEADPVRQFNTWWQDALEAKIVEVNAMTLATASADGMPSARTVLMK